MFPFYVVMNSLFVSYRGDWVRVGLCYPPNTTFQVMSQIVKSQTFPVEEYQPVNSIDELEKSRTQAKYFFDNSAG